jgi:hypothetical protein
MQPLSPEFPLPIPKNVWIYLGVPWLLLPFRLSLVGYILLELRTHTEKHLLTFAYQFIGRFVNRTGGMITGSRKIIKSRKLLNVHQSGSGISPRLIQYNRKSRLEAAPPPKKKLPTLLDFI